MILYESMIDDLNFNYELEVINCLFESYLIEFNVKETLNKVWETIKKFFKETLPKILKNLLFKISDLKGKIKKEDLQKKTDRILDNINKGREFTMTIPQLYINKDEFEELGISIVDNMTKIDAISMALIVAAIKKNYIGIKFTTLNTIDISDKNISDYVEVHNSEPMIINTKVINETKDSISKIEYNTTHTIKNHISKLNKYKTSMEKAIDRASSDLGKNIKSDIIGYEFNVSDDIINNYINECRELIKGIMKTTQAVNFQLSIYNSMLNGYISIINKINKEINIDIKYN